MKPKRGEMTFEQNMACKELLLWEQEAHGVNYNLATREHLASMGLVTQAEYDALQTRYLDLVTKVEELREFAYEQEKPQPTCPFQVGDKVKIVKALGHALPMGFEGVIDSIDKDGDFVIYNGTLKQFLLPDCLELIEAAPQPHVWRVGQYAKCPDGKVRRVTHANNRSFLEFQDKTGEYASICTPVPEPEMPELPSFCTVEEDGRITDRVACFTRSLEQWIAFYDGYDYQSRFIALRDWRALTGRMV